MIRRSKIKFQPNIKVSNRQKEKNIENQESIQNASQATEASISLSSDQEEIPHMPINAVIKDPEDVIENVQSIGNSLCTNKANKEAAPCKLVSKFTSDSKPNEAKPKKKIKISSKGIIDKSKVTLHDFLYFNPPLSKKKKKEENVSIKKPVNDYECDTELEDDQDDKDNESIGPRVKVGPDGQLILDEESLVIKKKPLLNNTIIEEPYLSRATYSSFKRNASRNTRWTPEETLEFYTALSLVGSDFSLMADLFFNQRRSRTDLKNKFRRESKTNKLAIDKALYEGEYEYCLAEDSPVREDG